MAGQLRAPNKDDDITLSWVEGDAARAEVGAWIGARIALDGAYISHGEVQAGLSRDGRTWIEGLAQVISGHAVADSETAIACARAQDETLLAAAIVRFSLAGPAPFAVTEDLVVEPGLRNTGIGGALMTFIETEAHRRGAAWAFLESGLRNERAHDFFQERGYEPISKVFAKRLD